MNIHLAPRRWQGAVSVPPSKSLAHRHIALAALSPQGGVVELDEISRDVAATIRAVSALGANIHKDRNRIHIGAARTVKTAVIDVDESATTLRFFLAIAPALAQTAVFTGSARLGQRLGEAGLRTLAEAGVAVEGTGLPLTARGPFRLRKITVDASQTAQFASGFLLAALAMPHQTEVQVRRAASRPYITMTAALIRRAGGAIQTVPGGYIVGDAPLQKIEAKIEGDWSQAAYFYGANALGSSVRVQNIQPDSLQGDRAVGEYIETLRTGGAIDLTDHPDLFPPLAVVASRFGGKFYGIERLRKKESDRIRTTADLLGALGIDCDYTDGIFTVRPGTLRGGTVDARGDHRIAFSAAMASTAADGAVVIRGAEAVDKSWPGFFDAVRRLGGKPCTI